MSHKRGKRSMLTDITRPEGRATRDVLLEIGHSETEVQKLIDAGVASESWSRAYLPS